MKVTAEITGTDGKQYRISREEDGSLCLIERWTLISNRTGRYAWRTAWPIWNDTYREKPLPKAVASLLEVHRA
jgi:hypothetical protein